MRLVGEIFNAVYCFDHIKSPNAQRVRWNPDLYPPQRRKKAIFYVLHISNRLR